MNRGVNMITQVFAGAALALALGGCVPDGASQQQQAPKRPAAPPAPAAPAPAAPDPVESDSDHCGDVEWWSGQTSGDPSRYVAACGEWPHWIPQPAPVPNGNGYDGTAPSQEELDQAEEQLPAPMPEPPVLDPADPNYDQQLEQYEAEVNQYMCDYGNDYTVPENQRTC